MLLLIVLISMVLVGALCKILYRHTRLGDWCDTLGSALLGIGVCAIVISGLAFWATRTKNQDIIIQRSVLQQSLDDARSNGTSDMERAAILEKVINFNTELANIKYWYPRTDYLVGVFRNPAVVDLEPVK